MNGGRSAVCATALACVALLVADVAAGDGRPAVARGEGWSTSRIVPDAGLVLPGGQRVRISSLWQEQPLLLAFFFRRCTGICTPFLASVRDAARIAGGAGRDYRILAVALDEAGTMADLRAQAASLGLLDAPAWTVAAATPEDAKRLARAFDYDYRLDLRTRQYDHDALLAAIDDGRVVRVLVATPGAARRMVGLVQELRGVFVSAYETPGGAALRCVSFDPASGAMRTGRGMALLALPALGALVLASAAFALARPSPGRHGSCPGLGSTGSVA